MIINSIIAGAGGGSGSSIYHIASSKTFEAGGLSLTFVIQNPGTYDNYLIKAYVYSIWKNGVEDTTRTYHTSSTTQLCDSFICIIPKYTTTAFKYGTADTQANGANVYGFSERIVASSGVRSRDKITTAPTIESSNITITLPSNNNIRAPGFGQTYNYELWAWNNPL